MSLCYPTILSRLSTPELIEFSSQRITKLIGEEHFFHDFSTVIRFLPTLHSLLQSYRSETFISQLEDTMGESYGSSYIQRLSGIQTELNQLISIWDRYPFLHNWNDIIHPAPEEQLINEFYHEAFFTEPSIESSITLLIWICELKKQYQYILFHVEEYHELLNDLLFNKNIEEVSRLIDSVLQPILR